MAVARTIMNKLHLDETEHCGGGREDSRVVEQTPVSLHRIHVDYPQYKALWWGIWNLIQNTRWACNGKKNQPIQNILSLSHHLLGLRIIEGWRAHTSRGFRYSEPWDGIVMSPRRMQLWIILTLFCTREEKILKMGFGRGILPHHVSFREGPILHRIEFGIRWWGIWYAK